MSCKRILLYSLYSFMIIVGLFFTILGAMFYSTAYHTSRKGCRNKPITPINFIHRGDTSVSQENTIDAGLSAVKKGYGTEFDLFILATGEVVLFHDAEAKKTTGTDLIIEKSTWQEFSKLQYNKTLYGVTYPSQKSPPRLDNFLKTICEYNPNAFLNFDIKFEQNEANLVQFQKVFDNSPCNCTNPSNYYLYSTPYPWHIPKIRKVLENSRCQNVHIDYYVHPNSYPGGEYFWLSTRFFINLWEPDIISMEHQIIDKHPELLKGFNEDGFCTATYSNTESYLKNYNVNFNKIIDLSIASMTSDVYVYNGNGYRALAGMTVIGVLLLALGLLLMILTICNVICKPDNNSVFPIKTTESNLDPEKGKIKN